MNEFLVQLIVVAVLANVVLLLAALIVPRLRRSSRPLAAASSGPSVDAMSVAPITISAMTAQPAPAPTSPEPEAEGEPTTMRQDTEDTERQRRFVMPPEDEYPTPESIEAFLTAGQRREEQAPMVDEQTGLETGFAWEMAVEREEKRVSRYGKSVTVVIAELDRLEALASRLGADNADRLVPPVATTLRRLARSADLVARTGHARFQVLMPETDEIQAINYIERIRDACDMWLEAAAVSVRLVVGWASAGSGVTIRDATRVAEQRMHADRGRSPYARSRASAAGPGRIAAQEPGPGAGTSSSPAAPATANAAPSASAKPEPAPPQTAPAPSLPAEGWRPGPATGPTV